MSLKREVDIIVIGGGPAGLASAVSAKKAGAGSVLVIERDANPGGILPQCIHTGFGLFEFNEELTGPEYASRWIQRAILAGIEFWTDTMAVKITKNREVTVIGLLPGIQTIKAKAVILAMGCREKTRGALGIPGYRPAGIYTAGCAQRLVNMEGLLPGKRVVILGSGDIGLIMARRLTLEGAKVVAVCEKMPHAGGLERNVQQCLFDFDIPLRLSSTIIEICGIKRVEGVVIARLASDGNPIPETIEKMECDTVLLSVGLIPENELTREAQIELNPLTGGPVVDENMQTKAPGIFACGNVLKVYDLVDHVSEDAIRAGKEAWRYASKAYQGGKENQNQFQRKQTIPENADKDIATHENNQPLRKNVQNQYADSSEHVEKKEYREDQVDLDSSEKEEHYKNNESSKHKNHIEGSEYSERNGHCKTNRHNELCESGEINQNSESNKSDIHVMQGNPTEFAEGSVIELVCTVCPVGCKIKAGKNINGDWVYTDYTCKRGLEYAKNETTNPRRTLTTTILQRIKSDTAGETCIKERFVAVRSNNPIPLNQMQMVMNEIKKTILYHAVNEGDVVISDILNTKADIIITRA